MLSARDSSGVSDRSGSGVRQRSSFAEGLAARRLRYCTRSVGPAPPLPNVQSATIERKKRLVD